LASLSSFVDINRYSLGNYIIAISRGQEKKEEIIENNDIQEIFN
jgi:hypothetical protein